MRPYFTWASWAAPFVGMAIALVPDPFSQTVGRMILGAAVASVPGVICAFVAKARAEVPRYGWIIGLVLNAYGLLLLLTGLAALSGLIRIHL